KDVCPIHHPSSLRQPFEEIEIHHRRSFHDGTEEAEVAVAAPLYRRVPVMPIRVRIREVPADAPRMVEVILHESTRSPIVESQWVFGVDITHIARRTPLHPQFPFLGGAYQR